jgi:phosphopantothenoylcysteine decarboxylase/phosphopantothenate--cysteine ligase
MLVTAGPTHEAIDAVRYIANRSSGKMGVAIAEAARDDGWDVTLLLGPVELRPPANIRNERFVSTEDLQRLLDAHFGDCDVLVMAAAVADYRPATKSATKLPRAEKLVLKLTPARKEPHQRIVGFALEESLQLDERSMRKLQIKKLDAIVANPLETMGAASIEAKVFTADGNAHTPLEGGLLNKEAFAKWLVKWIEQDSPVP